MRLISALGVEQGFGRNIIRTKNTLQYRKTFSTSLGNATRLCFIDPDHNIKVRAALLGRATTYRLSKLASRKLLALFGPPSITCFVGFPLSQSTGPGLQALNTFGRRGKISMPSLTIVIIIRVPIFFARALFVLSRLAAKFSLNLVNVEKY